jgi:hypothetical protein
MPTHTSNNDPAFSVADKAMNVPYSCYLSAPMLIVVKKSSAMVNVRCLQDATFWQNDPSLSNEEYHIGAQKLAIHYYCS